jgi:hypothetical protein
LAENYYSDESIESGDIVRTKGKYFVGKAATGTDAVLGVVSTKPGIILGESDLPPSSLAAYPIGLVGRVPVKVSTENGTIKAGDRIALSNLPGVGMREYGSSTPVGGTIVGIALEDFDGSNYLSEATVEVETKTVATGTPVCTRTAVTNDLKQQGGIDLEGGSKSHSPQGSTVSYKETCTQDHASLAPSSGEGEASSTAQGMTVKVGKILMFIAHDTSDVFAGKKSSGLIWLSQNDDVMLGHDLDLNSNALLNVSRITSASGNWHIDEEGNFRIISIDADSITARKELNVGTADRPTGVTIFDTVSGSPYCIQVAAGALSTAPGQCVAAPALANPSPQPSPTPVSPPSPLSADTPPPDTSSTSTPTSETPPPEETAPAPTDTISVPPPSPSDTETGEAPAPSEGETPLPPAPETL